MTGAARLRLFLRRELRDAVRGRWFIAYSAVFLVGGAVLIGLGARDTMLVGYRGYARALTGLVHFGALFVPLLALFPAAAALAEERESGTLEYLLAQPVTRGEVFLGKWTGVAVAVTASISAGYLVAGGLAVARGVGIDFVLASYAFLVLLALAFVSIGLGLSAVAETRGRAVTIGLVGWLAFLALGSLGAVTAMVRWGAPAGLLVGWTFVNPVEAFRLGMVALIDPELGLLGPVGVAIASRSGPAGVLAGAAASLLIWIAVPLALGSTGVVARRDGA
ncbi:MAG: ABC transporter permease subunit [Gemmatimonadota bacterium]|nr:ABC transporter permease subunit [Gemmatimonadota bacterium]